MSRLCPLNVLSVLSVQVFVSNQISFFLRGYSFTTNPSKKLKMCMPSPISTLTFPFTKDGAGSDKMSFIKNILQDFEIRVSYLR